MADEYDFQIDDLKFRAAISDDFPYQRATAPFRKEQFDSAPTVGDQSLTGWWTRGQLSFHKGAGLKYYEVLDGQEVLNRFLESENVSVSEAGVVGLRRNMRYTAASVDAMTTYYANPIRHNFAISPAGTSLVNGVSSGSGTLTAGDTTHTKDTGAYKYVASGTNNHIQFYLDPVSEGETYTARISVWLASGCPDVTWKQQGDTSPSVTTTAVRDAWQDLEVTFTGRAASFGLILEMPGSPPAGSTLWADQVICEQGTEVGTYFDSTTAGATGLEGGEGATLDTGKDPWRVLVANMPDDSSWSFYAWIDPATGARTEFSSISERTTALLVSGSTVYRCNSGGTRPLFQKRLYDNVGKSWALSEGDPITKLAWGKFRLWGVGRRALYQIDPSIADLGTQTAFFVNPNQDWQYTDIAEGPAAMYVSGHDGNNSSVSAITLNTDGSVPTLTGAQVSAQLPTGELIERISILAGGLMGIGTTRGFRVALIDSGGGLTYGPLIVEPDGVLHCTAIATDGADFLVAFESPVDGPAVYRISTEDEVSPLCYAWTRDVVMPGGNYVTQLDSRLGRLVASTDTGSLYVEDVSQLKSSGYLTTGYHRFGTLDPKSFQTVSVRCGGDGGGVAVYRVDADGTETALGAMGYWEGARIFPIGLSAPTERIALKFTFTRDGGDATTGPELLGYQIKALPVPERQRILKWPLALTDRVSSRYGKALGRKGKGWDDVQALEALESSAAVVTFTDHRTGETGSAYIDSVEFVSNTPSLHNDNGFGGIAYLTLRVID